MYDHYTIKEGFRMQVGADSIYAHLMDSISATTNAGSCGSVRHHVILLIIQRLANLMDGNLPGMVIGDGSKIQKAK